MVVRLDKCSTFGIKKVLSKSAQYLPKLRNNKDLIPRIKTRESFDRYVLSKLSRNFTAATISKTWVIENVDSLVNKYIRQWLEVPISGKLSNVFLTRNKFYLNILTASVKFIQCQTVLRNALKTSPNDSINELWESTNNRTNIQYDSYNSTKEVLKTVHYQQQNKLRNRLKCQGFNSTRCWRLSTLLETTYLETRLHTKASCKNFLNKCKLLVDLPGFESPSIITGDEYRPDLLVFTSSDTHLYVVELTVGFESNLTNNFNRKKAKYENLIR
ncbi:Hypothetical predicted protein [Paramuricea clavata]|uniref:Uncharacterized protein n=1 Tax=Paramuricea clavata TaxID=317549 RepID=A0A7D9EVX8_PARCT|nr:Hypothetical predicted protein [Paramuricea clavata]